MGGRKNQNAQTSSGAAGGWRWEGAWKPHLHLQGLPVSASEPRCGEPPCWNKRPLIGKFFFSPQNKMCAFIADTLLQGLMSEISAHSIAPPSGSLSLRLPDASQAPACRGPARTRFCFLHPSVSTRASKSHQTPHFSPQHQQGQGHGLTKTSSDCW